jgi:hypothetical protein
MTMAVGAAVTTWLQAGLGLITIEMIMAAAIIISVTVAAMRRLIGRHRPDVAHHRCRMAGEGVEATANVLLV